MTVQLAEIFLLRLALVAKIAIVVFLHSLRQLCEALALGLPLLLLLLLDGAPGRCLPLPTALLRQVDIESQVKWRPRLRGAHWLRVVLATDSA